MNAHCPTLEQLESLSLGKLNEEQSDVLILHLESCDSCQNELAQIDAKEDSLIAQLKSSATQAESPYEEASGTRVAVTRALAGFAALANAPKSLIESSIPTALGEYEIVRPLGLGGMGHVYLGKHTKLNRMVAIKFIADHRRWDRTMHERFESEMRLIGGLKHPHIVSAYDAREVDGLAVLVTEFIDGMTLSEILNRAGKIDVASASKIVADVCEALQYIQSKGLVHRDIKPSNIMIDRDGNVKLLDLGLARLEQSAEAANSLAATNAAGFTVSGQAMGTADYIPPEQINDSRSVDIRADIYGLGCTFYKLLTGKAPFAEHSSVFSKMNAHVSETPVSLKNNELVPTKIAKLIDKMLAKEPERRPQQPSDVARVLEDFSGEADLRELVGKTQAMPVQPRNEAETSAEKPQPQGSGFSKIPWSTLIATVAAGLFGFWLGVIVTIKKPDGTTATVEIPSGSTAVVDDEGNVEICLADSEKMARIDKSDVAFASKGQDLDSKSSSKASNAQNVWGAEQVNEVYMKKVKEATKGAEHKSRTILGPSQPRKVTFEISTDSELYQKVEPGDEVDIFVGKENPPGDYALNEKLVAAKVEVIAVSTSPMGTGSLIFLEPRKDVIELGTLERSEPNNSNNISFRFHNPQWKLLDERLRINGVWRSVLVKINDRVTSIGSMLMLFHKDECLMGSSGNFRVQDYQLDPGVIRCFYRLDQQKDEAEQQDSEFKYRFLESGRLELFEPKQNMLIRLEKVDTPESQDEKTVFEILAKANRNPEYFQAFIVEPAKAADPDALVVPDKNEHVKLVGNSVINRNHVISADVVDDNGGYPALSIKLTPEGGARMAMATKKNMRKQMALMIDGQVKMAPMIMATISDSLELSGNFEKAELEEIASKGCVKLDVLNFTPIPDRKLKPYENYAKRKIKQYDRNGDGKLSESELKKMQGRLNAADVDGDGLVSETEIVNYLSPSSKSRPQTGSRQSLSGVISSEALAKLRPRYRTLGNPSRGKIHKLILAMYEHVQKNGSFPASKCQSEKQGHPFSWRVALLPYLEHQELFDQYNFDEPWDSAANAKVLEQMPDVFRHPSSPKGSTETGYVGIAGKHGAFGIEKPKGFADFTDGTSDSIFVIELKTGIPWTKPDDLMLDSLKWESQAQFEKAFTQLPFFDPEKVCVGMADASAYCLDKEKLHVEIKTTIDKAPAWMNLFTIDDGNPINVSDYLFEQHFFKQQ